MDILYQDSQVVVCVKPERVLSTDEPGGVPELVRRELGDPNADVRTVHRLDRVVGGVMVLARSAPAASELSRQVREDELEKEYLAVVHGSVPEHQGTLTDLLYRDKARKMTFVAREPGKGVQEAILHYRVEEEREGLSLIRIRLQTGRTHQIRVQFSSRGLPLVGERKYAVPEEDCGLALWSCRIGFRHPETGEFLRFSRQPDSRWPWSLFPQLRKEDV